MKHNMDIYHRRSIRLKHYDYTQSGAYFITICTHERECLFGQILHGFMDLNILGKAIEFSWNDLPNHHPVKLGSSVIMPNHFHGIIHLVGAQPAVPKTTSSHSTTRAQQAAPLQRQFGGMHADSISTIVRSLKSACTKRINEMCNTSRVRVWQRNYHEHIIRNENEYTQLAEYMIDNPRKWEEDSLYPNFME